MNFYEFVNEFAHAFTTTERKTTGEQHIVIMQENAPQWARDIVYRLHGDKLPDDNTYDLIDRVANHLCDTMSPDDSPEDARDLVYLIEPDFYHSDLLKWLGGHIDNAEYVTQAMSDDAVAGDVWELLQMGQKRQIEEIASALIDELEKLLS